MEFIEMNSKLPEKIELPYKEEKKHEDEFQIINFDQDEED